MDRPPQFVERDIETAGALAGPFQLYFQKNSQIIENKLKRRVAVQTTDPMEIGSGKKRSATACIKGSYEKEITTPMSLTLKTTSLKTFLAASQDRCHLGLWSKAPRKYSSTKK
jgi:hypothetical protein